MPYYEFECTECKGTFLERGKMSKPPQDAPCPVCQRKCPRKLSFPKVIYRARGFTGAGRKGEGRIDPLRNADGSAITDVQRAASFVGNR